MKKIILSAAIGLLFTTGAQAQSFGFTRIYNLFQDKCVSCHSNSSPQSGLDLEGSGSSSQKKQAVYDNLVNIAPANASAAAKGYKYIAKGYPEKSYLLRKVAHTSFESGRYALEQPAEGNQMPDGQMALTNIETELIRQWILFGAPQSSNVANETTITNYYNGLGLPTIPPPPAPPQGQGMQLHLGKIFLAPGQEVEYFIKRDLELPANLEVNRLDLKMNSYSHHFILLKYKPGMDAQMADGLRAVTVFNFNPEETDYLQAWSTPKDINLPAGTAYTFPQATKVDLNYHLNNYNQDSILGAELYLNIWFQPEGTAQKEMHSDLISLGFFDLVVPSDNQEHTFTQADFFGNSPLIYNIWAIRSHTHKYGTDYDVYLRNPDGTKGQQIYEGFLDEETGIDLGYYNWSHPPSAVFEPFVTVPWKDGLIQEAKFRNCCTSPSVEYGLTTDDEMMLYYIQYTLDIASDIDEKDKLQFSMFPNPTNGNTNLRFYLDKATTVSYDVYDNIGRLVYTQNLGRQTQGLNTITLDAAQANLAAGSYFIRLQADGNSVVKQLVVE